MHLFFKSIIWCICTGKVSMECSWCWGVEHSSCHGAFENQRYSLTTPRPTGGSVQHLSHPLCHQSLGVLFQGTGFCNLWIRLFIMSQSGKRFSFATPLIWVQWLNVNSNLTTILWSETPCEKPLPNCKLQCHREHIAFSSLWEKWECEVCNRITDLKSWVKEIIQF